MNSETPCGALKTATHDLHQRIDQGSVMGLLMQPNLSVETYAAVLRRLLGCYESLEPALDQFCALKADLPSWLDHKYYKRSDLLKTDLMALGLNLQTPRRRAIDNNSFHPRRLSPIISTAHAAGVIYVIAGSAMGASVMKRLVVRELGEAVSNATHFLDASAHLSIPKWQAIKAELDADIQKLHGLNRSEKGARETFQHFIDWLTPELDVAEYRAIPTAMAA